MNKEILDMIAETESLDKSVKERIEKIAPSLWYILENLFYYGNDLDIELPVANKSFRVYRLTGEESSIHIYEIERKRINFLRTDTAEWPLFRIVNKPDGAFSISCSYEADDLKGLEMVVGEATKIVMEKVYNKKKTATERIEAVDKIEDIVLGAPVVNENI